MTAIGFSLEGMAGPGSGTWTRFELVALGLVATGLDVHVCGTEGVHERALELGLSSVALSPRLPKLKRLFGRAEHVRSFAESTGSSVVHLEAPPFVGAEGVRTIAALHDLRHLSGQKMDGLTGEAIYQKYVLSKRHPNISAWLALSDWGAQEIIELLRLNPADVSVIPPIVMGPPKKVEQSAAVPYVLALGHIEPRKNLEALLRATACKDWPSGLELWIAGEDHGSLGFLQQLAKETKTPTRFLGAVTESQKWELLAQARIVAVPSIVEGFGIVAVEAPLSGTPVAVSNTSGLSQLAGHPFARVPWNSPSTWASTIAVLHRDAALHADVLATQLRQSRMFSSDAVVPKFVNLYRRLGVL